MKIVTTGLTASQRLEAVMKAARVDEHRARAMLEERGWDAVVLDGNVLVGPSVFDAAADRESDSAAVGELVVLEAHAVYGEARTIGDSAGTILVTPSGGERELVRE